SSRFSFAISGTGAAAGRDRLKYRGRRTAATRLAAGFSHDVVGATGFGFSRDESAAARCRDDRDRALDPDRARAADAGFWQLQLGPACSFHIAGQRGENGPRLLTAGRAQEGRGPTVTLHPENKQ